MFRRFICTVLLGCLGACAKPDLPDLVVPASSTGELTLFREELARRFAPEQLRSFDTAIKELQLDAMNRDVAGAAAREQDMRAAINGKSVQATLVLGWKARRDRLHREIAQISELLEHDLQRQRETSGQGTPASVLTHIENERDILARLQRDLTETERQLAAWGKGPEPVQSVPNSQS